MGSVLARATNGMDVAIVQMGATLPTSNPPLRVAEEYAMLDCISGGRLVAGLPLGSPMDVNLCYGITPMEHRERYREAVALTLKAWQAREIFSWNGRYFQLGDGEPVAAPDPAAASAGVGPGLGQHQHLRLRRRARRLLLLPELLGRPVREDDDGRLLARGGREGPRAPIRTARASCSWWSWPRTTRAPRRSTRGTSSTSITSACTCPRMWFSPPGNQDYRSLVATMSNPVRRAENPEEPPLP